MKLSFWLATAPGFLLLTGCGDYRGASEPFSYAPATATSVWVPPKCIQRAALELNEVDPYELRDKALTLAEVIDIALSNSPSTHQSWAEAKSASAAYGQSLQNYFVLSNLTSDYSNYQQALFTGLSNSSPTNIDNTADSGFNSQKNTFHGVAYGADFNLSYTILDFGQTKATSKAALAALYEADFSHNSNLQSTVNLIMNDYYTYLANQSKVEAGEQDVANAQIALDAVLEKFENGLADMGDKVQATTNLLQQKIILVEKKQQLTASYAVLLNDMGFPANAFLNFEKYPEKLQLFEIVDLTTLVSMAMNHRPDLLASESNFKMREEELKLSKTKRYPTISGSFQGGRQKANLNIGSYYDYNLTVSMDFPLFQGFFIQNGIKKAQANLETAKAKLKKIKLSIIQDVTTYFHNVNYAKEAYFYAKEFLKSAEIDFQVNLEEYKAGTSTIVDLIQAQTAVSDAQAQLIVSQKQWYSSVANLSYSTGILTSGIQDESFVEKPSDNDSSCELPLTALDETF